MLLIYSTNPSAPRLRYTMAVLFEHLLPCSYEITDDEMRYRKFEGPRLNYSRHRLEKREVFLPAGDLLFERGIKSLRPSRLKAEYLPYPAYFPQQTPEGDLPFDLPALMFYLLSRYEEYLPFDSDQHGRFPATESFSHREQILEQPLVDQWSRQLEQRIKIHFPNWSRRTTGYRFLPTYDIDLAWAFRHRGLVRQLGGSMRSLLYRRTEDLRLRFEVLSGRATDPYDTFSYLDRLNEKYGLKPVYFFLLADPGRYDPNPSPRKTEMRALIRRHQQLYDTGIHPSYYSSEDQKRMAKEIQRLERITSLPVRQSRQHFLRFRLPDTYRQLLNLGIRREYSMGYADAVGFRAGTATPFPWYDLVKEEKTELMIYPFQAMDASLKNYMQLSPDAAREKLQQLIKCTKAAGGTFSCLWHNSSFSAIGGWAGWAEVYEHLLEVAAE